MNMMSKSIANKLQKSIGIFLICLGMSIQAETRAQQPSNGYSRSTLAPLEKKINDRSYTGHTNIQPAAQNMDSSFFMLSDSTYAVRKYKNMFSVKPLGDVAGGYQFQRKQQPVSSLTAGINLQYNYSNKLFAQAGYSLQGALPANYLGQYADSLHIQPGVGYAISDGNNMYHSHYTYGNLSYFTGKYFHFEIGKGKHFWGDGYRSLILSDVSNAYPYARITTQFWRIKYTNLWAQMRDISAGQLLKKARKKYVALHALSWNVSKEFNWSIYEMVVWQDRDSNSTRTLDMNYLNPVIFYRPVEYSQGSPDNVILATSLRYKVNEHLQLYGQLVIDEFLLNEYQKNTNWWGNKFGGQLGLKAFDVIIPNLHFQIEVNAVRPFTYTHGSPIQAWGNLNQPLAHPMGTNFAELMIFSRYDYNLWSFTEQFSWAAYGRDRDKDGDGVIDNFGGDIFRSYENPFETYQNDLQQGLKSTFHYQEFTAVRKLSANSPLELYGSYIMRFSKNEFISTLDHFILAGIRITGMLRPARDF